MISFQQVTSAASQFLELIYPDKYLIPVAHGLHNVSKTWSTEQMQRFTARNETTFNCNGAANGILSRLIGNLISDDIKFYISRYSMEFILERSSEFGLNLLN